jgi:hypothetical protein
MLKQLIEQKHALGAKLATAPPDASSRPPVRFTKSYLARMVTLSPEPARRDYLLARQERRHPDRSKYRRLPRRDAASAFHNCAHTGAWSLGFLCRDARYRRPWRSTAASDWA